jgi:hypothetical protein
MAFIIFTFRSFHGEEREKTKYTPKNTHAFIAKYMYFYQSVVMIFFFIVSIPSPHPVLPVMGSPPMYRFADFFCRLKSLGCKDETKKTLDDAV